MIETLALYLAVSCPAIVMQNRTKWPWNTHDRETMAYCQNHCSKEYDYANRCLKLFVKWGKQDYHCICGKP